MGVSITAYRNVEWLHDPTLECWNEGEHCTAYAYDAFRAALDGVRVTEPFEGAPPGLILGPCYADPREEFDIMDLSYLEYGRWRRAFSFAVQGRAPEEVWVDPTGPAADLIHFADNEGCIGPVAAARLLAVFNDPDMKARYVAEPRVNALGETEDEVWERWRHGLTLAADGGLVVFA